MNTRTTLILAVCLAVVGLYMAFVAKPWKEAPKAPEAPKPQDVWAEKPKQDDVERVEIVSSRDPKRVFVKNEDKWLIEEPVKAAANKWQVDDMVREIADLKCVKKYEKGSEGRPSDATTGLGAPLYTVTLKIGQRTPTGGDTYVQKPGSDDILVVDKNLHEKLAKRLSDLRDKRVTDFKAEEAVRVKVAGAENFELVKANNEWMIESPVRCRADKTKVDNLIRALSSMYAQDFTSDKPVNLRAYGLAEPRLSATVTIEHKKAPAKKPGEPTTNPAETQPSTETQTLVVQYGGPTDAKAESYYAKIGGEDPVFTVAKSSFTDASPKLMDLRDKQLAKVDIARCRKIEVGLPKGNESFTLTKKGPNWEYADGTIAEAALVDDLLKAVRDLKAVSFESKESIFGINTDRPRAKVTVTQEGEPAPITVMVLDPTPSQKNTYIKTSADDSIGVVPEDSVAQLLAEPISYRKREMLSFDRNMADRIEIAQGDQTSLLTKNNNKWSMAAPITADADAEAVRNALSDLSFLRAKKVVGRGNAGAFGLDKPELTVSVTVESPKPKPPATQPTTRPHKNAAPTSQPGKPDVAELRRMWQANHPGQPLPPDLATEETEESAEAAGTTTAPAAAVTTAPSASTQPAVASQPAPPPKVYRVKFAKKGADVYAMVDGVDLVYQIDAKIYEHIAAEMRDRTVANFEVPQVTSVALVRPGDEMEFTQADGKWSYKQDNTVALDDQKIKDLLNAIRDTKAQRYVRYKAAPADLAAYKLDAPATKVIITTTGSKKTELRISSEGPAGDAEKSKYASVTGSDTVFLLKGDQVDKLAKKLGDFTKSEKTASSTPPPRPPGRTPAMNAPPDEE
jgi:hypothetical protein